jgi:hypothetical protein
MLTDAPVPGAVVTPADGDLLTWSVAVTAPETYSPLGGDTRPSPYAGRVFKLTFKFPAKYPFKPPDVWFEPRKMWHPQVRPALVAPPPRLPAPTAKGAAGRVVCGRPIGVAARCRRRQALARRPRTCVLAWG